MLLWMGEGMWRREEICRFLYSVFEQGGTQCAWMEPSTLVVMTAERLHGTVSLRWSSAWPKREGNQSKGSC